MPLPDLDSAVGNTFGLEVDGVTIKQIMEVSGLKMEQDVIELKEQTSDGKYIVKALPGRGKLRAEVTLTRGLTADQSFDKWIKDARFGKMSDARKNAAVTVFDYEGNPLKRYKMTNAWPKSLEISSLKAGDTSVLTEKLVITCEMLEAE
jgi:phage tail-like protein